MQNLNVVGLLKKKLSQTDQVFFVIIAKNKKIILLTSINSQYIQSRLWQTQNLQSKELEEFQDKPK